MQTGSSQNLAKIRRLLQLVEHLQSGRAFTAGQLAEMCQVSRRTMFRDLKTLQDSGVSILHDSAKQGYWLAVPTYLPPTDLTLQETLSLLLLSHEMGEQQTGVPFLSGARTAALKLMSNLPGQIRSALGDLIDVVDIRVSEGVKQDRSHFDRILESIRERCRIRIEYDSFTEGHPIRTLLSPYRLFFHFRHWYVIGRSSLHRSVRTFHLGRFLQSEIVAEKFEMPPRFSLDRYLGDAWRIIREPGHSHVVVRFQPLVARNVAESHWHRTQRMVWNEDGTLDFHADVAGLLEVQWWILGYGDQAEALEPPELRKILADRVAAMGKRYRKQKN